MRRERGVDLGDQLALAIAGAQLDGPVGLARGAVRECPASRSESTLELGQRPRGLSFR